LIGGLVSSVLPGLDDEMEVIQKEVLDVPDNAMVSVGRRYMVGSIWMSILRFPKSQSTGIKYLS